MDTQTRPITEYRMDRYETVDEFASFLGVAPDTLYRIQRGERPRFSTMKRIAQRLGVHPAEIEEFSPKRRTA